METVIRPSFKLLILCLAYLIVGLVSLWYGMAQDIMLITLLGALVLLASLLLLHFFLSTYVVSENGLYQHRKFTGVTFAAWDKVGQVLIERGFLEKWWGTGDLRIVGKDKKQLMRWRAISQPERVFELIGKTLGR